MSLINRIVSMLHIPDIKVKKKERKPSVIKDVIQNPDSFKLEMFVENEEIVIRVKRREEEES